MPLRVDLDRNTIEASIVELVAQVSPRATRTGGGLPLDLAARLGHRAHRTYRHIRTGEARGYSFEVPLEFKFTLDGFEARLRGRIDGLRQTDSSFWVEEVKSSQNPATLHAAALQVRLYALGLALSCGAELLHPTIVRLSPDAGPLEEQALEFDRAAVETELARALQSLIHAARGARATAQARQRRSENVSFAYPSRRPNQQQLIAEMQSSLASERPLLAMAPTGTGKTACALYAGLQYAQSQAAILYFASAKTSQQALAEATLKTMRGAMGRSGQSLRSLTLTARAKLCAATVDDCPHAHCPHRRQQLFSPPTYESAVQALFANAYHAGREQLTDVAQTRGLCGFDLSMWARDHVDVVLGDYNYVYRPSTAPGPRSRKQVIIVDEVHNLAPRMREQASCFLTITELRAAGYSRLAWPAIAELLQEVADEITEAIASCSEQDYVWVDGCAPFDVELERWQALHSRALSLRLELAERHSDHWPGNDPLIECLNRFDELMRAMTDDHQAQVTYLGNRDAPKGPGLGSICLDAAPHLERIHREQLGTLAMSATLYPIEDQARALGLSDLSANLCVLPSAFPREHRAIVIDAEIDTRLEARLREAPRIAERIQAVVELRAGNYLVCCSSFNFATTLRAQLDVPDFDIVMQIPGGSAAWQSQVMRKLLRRTSGQRPILLLAVTGGSLSEGIDLPGDALIGVIIVGPPIAPINFARALTRRHHDDEGGDGFFKAHIEPAMRKVVQSAGRLLRSPEDHGIIYLIGQRFAQNDYLRCLPPDWYDYQAQALIDEAPLTKLAQFWAQFPD